MIIFPRKKKERKKENFGSWTLAFRSEGQGQKEKEEKKYGKRMLTVNARLLR